MLFEILFIHVVLIAVLKTEFNPVSYRSCFENLGCLDVNESWYDKTRRPVNLEPLERHVINTVFVLIKPCPKKNDLVFDIVTAKNESLESAGFKKEGGVVFLIHDFTSNGYTGWIKHLVQAMPNNQIINVVSVDWQSGAQPPFSQAVANARVVALEITHFVNSLQKTFNLNPCDFYLIGHGVGAHIAGYVGKRVSGIRKITALDPTGPYFAGMPNVVKLTPSDASYVEVLHTDGQEAKSHGTMEPMGHADFYINNACKQPFCNSSSSYPLFTEVDRNHLKEGEILPACSHKRAFKYFIEALDDKSCVFLGIRCSCYDDFVKGRCTSCEAPKQQNKNFTVSCATFGFHSAYFTSLPNKFYLITRGEPPYCLHPYRVNISIHQDSKNQDGFFDMIMVDVENKVTNASTVFSKFNNRKFSAGNSYTFLYFASSPKVYKLKEVKLRWEVEHGGFCVVFCNRAIKVAQISIAAINMDGKSAPENVLSPEDQNGVIESGSYINFKPTPSSAADRKRKTRNMKTKRRKIVNKEQRRHIH